MKISHPSPLRQQGRPLLFALLLMLPSLAFCQQKIGVSGKVLESLMHQPMPTAVVTVTDAATDSVVTTFSPKGYTASYTQETGLVKTYTGTFFVELLRGKKYIFTVKADDYDTTTADVDLSTLGKRVFETNIPTIYITRAIEKTLGEVVVTASRIKFYHKGDTLVYNADAFNLAEGSMLDALFRQMPGVELKDDGQIYVNGKFVESLLLNGKDFFGNNKQLMLDNIAAYTVKNVMVYDKRGKRSEMAGADVGDTQFVMDVKLKKEYMVGSYLNAELGGGTSDRYMARLFGMAFTANNQYSFFLNANNLNDSRHPGQNTTWQPDKMPTGVRKTLTGGFDYSLKPKHGKLEANGNVSAESISETDATDILRTNYLVQGNTYDYQFSQLHNRQLNLATKHKIYYKPTAGYALTLEPNAEYRHWDYRSDDVSATLGSEYNGITAEFLRNIYDNDNLGALKSLINRNISNDKRKGHSLAGGASLLQDFKIPNTPDLLSVNLSGAYSSRRDERFNRYDIRFGQGNETPQNSNRYFKNYPDFNSSVGAELVYSRVLAADMTLSLTYGYKHRYHKETSKLYRLETLDAESDLEFGKLPSAVDYEAAIDRNNSYLSRQEDNDHSLTLDYQWYTSKGLSISFNMPITFTRQKLHYQRASVDTAITRNSFLPNIGRISVDWNKSSDTKSQWLKWNASLRNATPSLVNLVNITDDTDPMNIRRGNANLKNATSLETTLLYSLRNHAKGNYFILSTHYTMLMNAISQGYTYDTSTGIRQSSYYNVDGNWNIYTRANYWQEIGKHWQLENNLGIRYATNADLVGENTGGLSRSKVYDLEISDEVAATYSFGKQRLEFSLEGTHNRYSSNRNDFTRQNTWTINTSLNGLFTLAKQLQLSTDITLYSRRGYTDSALNSNNLVWNARLSYTAMKGKLLLMLDGYDILHDLSNVSYTVNAQMRTETYRTVLPRYLMFHVQWRFNYMPKPKSSKKPTQK